MQTLVCAALGAAQGDLGGGGDLALLRLGGGHPDVGKGDRGVLDQPARHRPVAHVAFLALEEGVGGEVALVGVRLVVCGVRAGRRDRESEYVCRCKKKTTLLENATIAVQATHRGAGRRRSGSSST